MTLRQPLHHPDPTICGCDSAPGLVPVDQAIARALELAPRLHGVDLLPTGAATGRVLAQDIAAPVPLPLFDNAAMDGYALCLDDLSGPGPWVLPVAGQTRAGDRPGVIRRGQAQRILTGAPVPDGADAVIAQEQVMRSGGAISIATAPRPGQHIRRCGEEIAIGARLLAAGRTIGAREAAALAAAGLRDVPVTRRLRVAILCSGSELVTPGASLAPGQIWDSNHAMLAAALDRAWIARIALPACADDVDALCAAVDKAATQADIVITTGGVSTGDEDHMARVIARLGGRIAVMKLAMKPGKPLSVGLLGRALWLGLPGNPVAAYVTWHVVGQILAGRMAGLTTTGPVKTLAALAAPVRHKPGRCEYRPAHILGHDARGVLQVACMDGAGAQQIAQLARADALVMIPSEAEQMACGDLVEVLPLHGMILSG
ncbi:gephyrin-like molybdotransferase Glp [Roseinatronobacter alkalisoli]|uniref:Molybdopterin molybdenumtransferase n=1 Tax=Roseinatronobacter alkalisoli TaxID=3028235 RepID=A0ABT5TB64_9RHOB|nr:gephyrin-like molybdotransferase Glp [Roseinatronobacter sp. HJB301]MDD7972324.1 molybdopterin molybdotransferase MoeA [Roseinatronobacter sp. HJB301]